MAHNVTVQAAAVRAHDCEKCLQEVLVAVGLETAVAASGHDSQQTV